jgi:glycosidase
LDLNDGGYPNTQTMNGVQVPVAPFQFSDSHDHSFLISFVGNPGADNPNIATVYAGDRSVFFKLQPFAIALYTCRGVPMLWEGQEFADDYVLPAGGDLRIHFQRDMNWSYFYDTYGHPLIVLYRKMAKLRRNVRALRSRDSFYYNVQSNPGNGIIAYHRHAAATATQPEQFAVVFLNFSDATQTISIPFPSAGTYTESVDANPAGIGPLTIAIAAAGDTFTLSVPSNYGYVYVK